MIDLKEINHTDNYRIEFNEKQQAYHLEWFGKSYMHEPETHGWITISESERDFVANRFIDYMEWRFKGKKVTSAKVKNEFNSFIWIANSFLKNLPLTNRMMSKNENKL